MTSHDIWLSWQIVNYQASFILFISSTWASLHGPKTGGLILDVWHGPRSFTSLAGDPTNPKIQQTLRDLDSFEPRITGSLMMGSLFHGLRNIPHITG